jgi:hypothetical protein
VASAQLVYDLSRAVLGEQDGVVAVYKVYMDESGVHEGSPVVNVAAYCAHPKSWRDWTKRWNVAKRPIKVFHATDAQNLQGEFKGWSAADRDDLVRRLLPIIAETEMLGVVIGIQMDEYRKAIKGRDDLSGLFGTPYAACFQWVVQTLMYVQNRNNNSQRMAFVHECNDYRREALDSFTYVKEHTNPQRAPLSIMFGDKATYSPLQAADILAYEGNKRMRDPSKTPRRSWQALNPDVKIIAAHYGKENMPDLIARMQKAHKGLGEEIEIDSGWRKFLTS